MKASLLVRFGGLTLFLSQFLLAVVDGAYYLSGRPAYPSMIIAWIAILGLVVRVLGFIAIFAILAKRGNVFGFAGFVFLIVGEFFSVAKLVATLGVIEGVVTGEQLGLVSSYIVIQRYLPWFFITGQFLLGIAIYQSIKGMKYIGILMAVLGILAYLTGPIAWLRPIYSVLAFVAWGWLGWELLTGRDRISSHPLQAN